MIALPSHEIVVIRYSGGKLRAMEDDVLAAVTRNSHASYYALRVIDNWDANRPLTEVWNRAIREACADVVTLLNSDCWVAPSWDVAVLRAVTEDPRIAIAAPLANVGAESGDAPDTSDPSQASLARAAKLCAEKWPGKVRDARIYGFCLSVRKSSWVALNGFDERIPLYGADDEFRMRAVKAGRRAVVVMDAYCWHKGEASARVAQAAGRMDLDLERARGRKLFAEAGGDG